MLLLALGIGVPIWLCFYVPFRYLTRQEWPTLR